MKEVIITKYGPPEVLQVRDKQTPSPKNGEILIRNHFTGINFAEIMARMRLYPGAPKPPTTLGAEGCGVIESIGDGVYISARTHINAFKDVVIEDNVLIGEDVYIGDTDHNYSENRPIKEQGWNFKGSVLIGNGSFISKGAVVLPGIEVGQNSVVGPYAVVTRNVPEHTLAMGNPARCLPIKSSN